MTVFDHQTGFTRGEIDETLYDRFDVDFYQAAVARMENWFPDVTGAVQRRPAFELADAAFREEDYFPDSIVARSFSFGDIDVVLTMRWFDQKFLLDAYKSENGGPFSPEFTSYELGEVISPEPDVPIARWVSIATAGPACFLCSRFFPPTRVFVNLENFSVDVEQVQFREEVAGLISVEFGSNSWEGEDSIFEDQLESGDKIYFGGQTYTVDEVVSQEEFTTEETYEGLSISGERITTDTDRGPKDPRLVELFKGRLFFFSTSERPTTMWASRAGDPFTVVPLSDDDDAPIEYDLLSTGADEFLWSSAEQQIYLGTSTGEYVVQSIQDEPITPRNFAFARISTVGGSQVPPISVDSNILFASRDRQTLFRAAFDFQRQGFVSDEVTLYAPHLFEDGVKQMVYRPASREDRVPRIFVLTDNNDLRVCAYKEDQNVEAWTRVTFAQSLEPLTLTAVSDKVFCLFEHTTEEGTELILGRLERDREGEFVVDFPREYDTSGGLDISLSSPHRYNTVAALSENWGFLGYYDTDDRLDLTDEFSEEDDLGEITVGLPFQSRIDLLPVQINDERGGTLNRKKRLVRTMVSVKGAYQLFVNNEPLFGSTGRQYNAKLPRRDGVYERRMLGFDERAGVTLEAGYVYRARVLSITREVGL